MIPEGSDAAAVLFEQGQFSPRDASQIFALFEQLRHVLDQAFKGLGCLVRGGDDLLDAVVGAEDRELNLGIGDAVEGLVGRVVLRIAAYAGAAGRRVHFVLPDVGALE